MFSVISVICINLLFFLALFKTLKKKDLLITFSGGRWWLTWLSISLITFIIESSSIFFAPAEIYQRIGYHTYFFILLAFFFYHYLTSRFVEISEIMEQNNIKEGGVYAFVDFVIGSNFSFLIVASLLVTYLLTACISGVSAIENNSLLIQIPFGFRIIFAISLIWIIAIANVLGIKLLPKVVFVVFTGFMFLIINLAVFGLFSMERVSFIFDSFTTSAEVFWKSNFNTSFGFLFFGISMMALSFNGLESVISNFKFTRSWKEVGKSYVFLFIIGFFIPILFWSLLPQSPEIGKNSGNMIPFYFSKIGGAMTGYIIGILAAFVLIIVINYSFNSFNDLLEKISKKFHFNWFLHPNRHHSNYRIHIINALLCSIIIILINANQFYLSELLALAILSNLTIILFCLLVYRYFRGTEQITLFNTSRFGTFIFFIILFGAILYLVLDKIVLSGIWILVIFLLFFFGSKFVKKRATIIPSARNFDNPMDLIFTLSDLGVNQFNIYFTRAKENMILSNNKDSVFINFFYVNEKISSKVASNHYRFPIIGPRLFSNILAIIELIKYEIPDAKLKVHFGWPLSSWLDRISIGVMIFSMMKLPLEYPKDEFIIEYNHHESMTGYS